MRLIVPLIWEAVRADVASGRSVDIDAFTQRFSEMRPELDQKTLRQIIVETVTALGGKTSRET